MRKIIAILLICFATKVYGNKISDAYEALSIFDYFKAKNLFYKARAKSPATASFGLATIYFRNDNPFSNIDSAAKYIAICKINFTDTCSYSLYHINYETINSLANIISNKGFEKYCYHDSVRDLNYFLSHFYFADASLLQKTYNKRDELAFRKAILQQESEVIQQFLMQYPQSSLYATAKNTFYNFQYHEKTPQKTQQQLQQFIKQYISNPNITDAEMLLFKLIKEFHSPDSVFQFIQHYSSAATKESAWKLLYSLSVKAYNKEELTLFLNKYPNYPFNESIVKEISLSQNILIPLKNTQDKYGYIDTLGNWVILPQFDDALAFNEGFASVCKNDSCYYINKEGYKTSNFYYEETENYKNGIAIVKKENEYYLINRSGQYISKGYQDINEVSDNLYVCKSNGFYGAINTKGEIIIPFEYNKLGNFKNKFAYYLSNQYGLVDIFNKPMKAQWDWISDVDTNTIAIVKNKNKFGLISINEELILPVEYDYISSNFNEIYLVVKNNLYGFYNSKEKCFITSINNNYNSSFNINYYTNGKYFKLLKDNEVALVDANGRYSINFGSYSNLFFAKCDIIRVQKNNKYGFIDRKLKPIASFDYDKATDFENNVSVVAKGTTAILIDKNGKSIFTLKNGEIKAIENSLFTIKQNEQLGLLDTNGKIILNMEYESINLIHQYLYICYKKNEGYLFNVKTNVLKKIEF